MTKTFEEIIVIAYFYHVLWYHYTRKTAAAESVTLYVRHALWNFYVCQSSAESECFLAYDFH